MVAKTVVHFEIPAENVEKLSAFYHRVFGWEFSPSEIPGLEYWTITTGAPGESVGGGMYRKETPEEGPRNYIAVDDIDSAIAEFTAAGGTEIVGKSQVGEMGWSYIGADPEGNVLGLFQPSMPEPASR